jgi:hypothetical protein
MTPTNKLRFVEREGEYESTDRVTGLPTTVFYTTRSLQQWWVSDLTGNWVTATEFRPDGEWRDVPVEKEDV